MAKIIVKNKKLLTDIQKYARELKCSVFKNTVLLKDLSRVDLFSPLGLQRQISLLNKKGGGKDYVALAKKIHTQPYENIDGFRIKVTETFIPEEIASKNYCAIIDHYFNGFISINKNSNEISVLSHTRGIVTPLLLSMLADFFDAEIKPKHITLYAPQEMIAQTQINRESIILTNNHISSLVGNNLQTKDIEECLHHFGYMLSHKNKKGTYMVTPAYYRLDTLSMYDVLEDILLCNIDKIHPSEHFTIRGARRESPQQNIATHISGELLSFGFKEVKLPELINAKKENFTYSKYTLRSSLLKSLLSYETTNRHKKYPHKIFEIGNIFKEKGYRENLCIIYTEDKADFNVLFSILFKIFTDALESPIYLKEGDYQQYEDGTSFSVVVKGKTIGTIGFVHPELKLAYKIKKPCLSAEIYLSKINNNLSQKS